MPTARTRAAQSSTSKTLQHRAKNVFAFQSAFIRVI